VNGKAEIICNLPTISFVFSLHRTQTFAQVLHQRDLHDPPSLQHIQYMIAADFKKVIK
jgi:hypothetical protein